MKILCLLLTLLLAFIVTGCASGPHIARGKHFFDKKKYEQAIHELEQAASEEGDVFYYVDTYALLGDVYAAAGQPDKAISVYRNALRITQLRLRGISARRHDIRRELNFNPKKDIQASQGEDMQLGDEESQLKEKGSAIKSKLKLLLNKE